jgi:hypothetical protein
MLQITIVKKEHYVNATLGWEGVNSEHAQEEQQKMEYVKPIHPSWCE